jgi:2-polyprenyl-3-methyl-5-hydroxy-6-metoxy-1,4-benzoquinol methylase
MTVEWKRQRALCIDDDRAIENWINPEGEAFELNAKYGNPLDIVALKSNIIADFEGRIDSIRESRIALYQSDRVESVRRCPACDVASDQADYQFSIYDARYNQCKNCGHVFVSPQPTAEAVDEYYAKSTDYSSTYTDIPSAMQRVAQIGAPRVKWVAETFERRFGRKPEYVLDVGAGGGHFVRASRDAGLRAEGVEISAPSRQFAHDHFGIDLIDQDFTTDVDLDQPDVITFWGVIEHVTLPSSLVEAAARRIGKEGLVVANVPRWNCLDTGTQSVFNDSVVRHLDPLGHINCFSDNSLAHLFSRFGFDPVAVWYFGMDAYETLMQCGLRSEDPKFFARMKVAIPALQAAIDRAALSDEIALAVAPR